MAGNAGNWFKVKRGPLKGQSVYLGKSDQEFVLWKAKGRATTIQDALALNESSILARANIRPPKGTAKASIRTGSEWAESIGGSENPVAVPSEKSSDGHAAYRGVLDRARASQIISATDQEAARLWGGLLSATINHRRIAQASSDTASFEDRESALDDSSSGVLLQAMMTAGEAADTLTRAAQANRTTEPYIVHRSVDDSFLDGLRAGAIIETNRLMATTLSAKWARAFGSSRMQIRMPTGTPALFVDAAAGGPTAHTEGEFLLPPGTKLRIDEVGETPGGMPLVYATVVPIK
jgi:hypothetical protein